ncbi:hypothetical protein RND81_09G064200 [Saponaria officinalis]|uniref:Uncharacterized protein n=1 Tax=Saponaria officinalis TaxID=3572 RepID=A0AAW1IIA2_SAPOF
MAGGSSSKKEKRRAKKAEKKAQQQSSNNAIQLPAEEFYKMANDEFNKVPVLGNVMDGILRNMIRGTARNWTLRFGHIPSLLSKTLVWVQLYALGSRVALAKDDSDVVERSRKLFKDAAPSFMDDYGLWIFSRSLVKKGYNGKIDDAVDFGEYDPLECLEELPLDPSSGIRCAEIFLFFAIDGDVPGDVLSSREAVMDFLKTLNSNDGTHKIHAFTVVAGSVIATREKLRELRGKHLTA